MSVYEVHNNPERVELDSDSRDTSDLHIHYNVFSVKSLYVYINYN